MPKKAKSNSKNRTACSAKKISVAKRELQDAKSGIYRWLDWFPALIRLASLLESFWEHLSL